MHVDYSTLTSVNTLAASHNQTQLEKDIKWAMKIDPSKYPKEVLKKLRYHYLIGLANQ